MTQIKTNHVNLSIIDTPQNGELAEKIYYDCCFCGQSVKLDTFYQKIHTRLSKPDFYCSFCLRHGHNTKNNKHVLPLSFRSIVGYYYNAFYKSPNQGRKMWLSNIKDYIANHEKIGLANPVFSYNPQSMLWFIDFNKVGKKLKKVHIGEVAKTISQILTSFDIQTYLPYIQMDKFYLKYRDALHKFYSYRQRPANRRILIPTFSGCGVTDSTLLKETRSFNYNQLKAVN